MKFLNLDGLTYFFNKVKTWASNNYLSLNGGTINGSVDISGNVLASQFKKTNGTSTQVLIADGSVKEINSANGVAGLDSNGNVPLSHLGNLDTTVAEVVTELPSTSIKKHIYMIRASTASDKNVYAEYIYTGDIASTYDATKWEKLGEITTTVELSDYVKTTTLSTELAKKVDKVSGKQLSTNDYTTAEKNKLSEIAERANNYVHPTSAAGAKAAGLYKITTDANGHVTAATVVAKTDITALGIPASSDFVEIKEEFINSLT